LKVLSSCRNIIKNINEILVKYYNNIANDSIFDPKILLNKIWVIFFIIKDGKKINE